MIDGTRKLSIGFIFYLYTTGRLHVNYGRGLIIRDSMTRHYRPLIARAAFTSAYRPNSQVIVLSGGVRFTKPDPPATVNTSVG